MILFNSIKILPSNFLLIISIILIFYNHAVYGEGNLTLLDLKVVENNNNYIVGEPIKIDVILKNNTDQSVNFIDVFSTSLGFLEVMISFDGNNYKKYRGPGWGLKRVSLRDRNLLKGEDIIQSVSLLYNHHGAALPDELSTFLAVPEAHTVYVKAVLNSIGFKKKIESDSVLIKVTEPVGADSLAWDIINKEKIVYFIQTGNPLGNSRPPVKFLENFIDKFPKSVYSKYVSFALKKYKKNYNYEVSNENYKKTKKDDTNNFSSDKNKDIVIVKNNNKYTEKTISKYEGGISEKYNYTNYLFLIIFIIVLICFVFVFVYKLRK